LRCDTLTAAIIQNDQQNIKLKFIYISSHLSSINRDRLNNESYRNIISKVIDDHCWKAGQAAFTLKME